MTQAPAAPRRLDVVDWLRGVAVVLMIQAHGFDAWLAPGARTGAAWDLIRHMSGLPSRLFLFLVGVSVAIQIETHLRRGTDAAVVRKRIAARGLQILGLAYLFRLQEWALAGFYGGWEQVLKIDILNAIGASMLVLAACVVPRGGRPRIGAALGAAAIFLGLGPVVGPAPVHEWLPAWLPRAITSYVGGERPLAWFPLFPWAAWSLAGVAVGHLWWRAADDPVRTARVFLLGGVLGAVLAAAALGARRALPDLIPYPSDLAQQMGPGSFFYRLGLVGVVAAIGWAAVRFAGRAPSPMRQLGRTSLLVYWIHVDLCYGLVARPIQKRLSIPEAAAGVLSLVLVMLAVSTLKTRHAAAAGAWWAGFRRRLSRTGAAT